MSGGSPALTRYSCVSWCYSSRAPYHLLIAGYLFRRLLCGGVSGEGEEDIIEGGTAQGQVFQANLRGVEVAHDGGEQLRAVCDRHDEVAALSSDLRFARTVGKDGLQSCFQIASVRDGQFEPLAADTGLQVVGGSVGDDAPLIDDGDAVGELIGLLQVLRGQQDGGAIGSKVADNLPHSDAPTWSRPVVGSSRKRTGGSII